MKLSTLAAAIGMTCLVNASGPATFCAPENNAVCYSFSVPEASVSSGQGDVFVQIKAPASMSWVGVAQSASGQMMGANMLVAYASQNDSSVTLSPRLGTGNMMPHFNQNAKAVLLDGSGIKDNIITANIKCSSCNSWQGGSMSLKDSASSWIFAYAPGESASMGPIRSDNATAIMSIHQGYGSFKVDLTKAVTNATNPFTNQNMASSSTNSGAMMSVSPLQAKLTMMKMAHGAIMGIAFGLLFPVGAIFMRLHGKKNTWAIHAGIQIFAYALSVAGLGTGIYLAMNYDLLMTPHAIIGIVIVFLAFFMPIAGWLQHSRYCKFQRRTSWGRGHAYLGRALLLLALINVGLGLQLAAPYGGVPVMKGEVAYGVLGGVMGVIYLAVIGVTAVLRRKSGTAAKGDEGNGGGIIDSGSSSHTAEPDTPIDGEKGLGPQVTQRSI